MRPGVVRGEIQLRHCDITAPTGFVTEWFPCGHSLFKIERGLAGVPPLMILCNEDGDHWRPGEDRSAGEVPTLRVLRSSKYQSVLPRGFRSRGHHLFDQSMCLIPGTMTIVAPRALHFQGCMAIMYAFDAFRQLGVIEPERTSSPVRIVFVSNLSVREAQVLLLSYLCLTESFGASGKSSFVFTVQNHSTLSELRKLVSANPRVHSRLVALDLSRGEEAMREDLEEEMLRIRDGLAAKESNEESGCCSGCEKRVQSEDQGDSEDDKWEEVESNNDDEEKDDNGEDIHEYTEKEGSPKGSSNSDCECVDNTDDEERAVAHITRVIGAVPRFGARTGHVVLFGRGGYQSSSFKYLTIGLRTLGLVDLKILRACGLFHSKHGRSRATLKIPNTNGVLPESCWLREGGTLLTDDLCLCPEGGGDGLPTPFLDFSECFFQLNYSPNAGRTTKSKLQAIDNVGLVVDMSRIEQAICSESARGYEEPKLFRLFRTTRRRTRPCPFEVEIDEPNIGDADCTEPLYKRSWLGSSQRRQAGPFEAPAAIGDGEYFPCVEIAREADLEESNEDTLAYPLSEYNLNLTIKSFPDHYGLVRADRAPGECGSVYEACLDEAVLLGHCARLSVTRGAKRNFDVSACLTWFYRSVHPCVPDMKVGDVMLDYEFTLHGRGELSPVYALLSHLAESCRVNCLPSYKLITLSRHRAASVWTRSTEAPFHTRRLRTNTLGAFLCAQDHRLSPLLSRCCNPKVLQPLEFWTGCELLPRGDEEALLLRAYSKTLGPVFEFDKVQRFPSKINTSLGDWAFMRLASRSSGVKRYPGTTVVDGYALAFAAESPLFYLRDQGPLVQKLESVAVVVESSSAYRTHVLHKEDPEWPGPNPLELRDRIKCKAKSCVIDEMFMRCGGRDPLEGYNDVNGRSWAKVINSRWTFKKAPGEMCQDQDWELDYPVSESLTVIGPSGSSLVDTVKWLCAAPPAKFTFGQRSCLGEPRHDKLATLITGVGIDSRTAQIRDPAEWKGFKVLCSRVLTCPTEKVWTRGVCKVVNKGLKTFKRDSLVPMANLIVIVEPGEWYALPCNDHGAQCDTAKAPLPPVGESLIYYNEVCSAPEFAVALACRMLSGEVHEDLEIKCQRRGVYKYLQRALAWFAGATGPFRSRSVTVFTPEADSVTECWTHTLPQGLDVLKTSSTSYLVSCKDPCREDVSVTVAKSKGIVRVNLAGNLVLHSNPGSLKVSKAMKEEPGVHAVVTTPVDGTTVCEGEYAQVHVCCHLSLREFCKLRRIPVGIRGPETWKKALPWSKREPGTFCSKVSELKYRWESGNTDLAEVLPQDSGRWYGEQLQWQRCSDGKLIPRRDRFWNLIDFKKSFVRQNATDIGRSDDGRPESPDFDEYSKGEDYKEEGFEGDLFVHGQGGDCVGQPGEHTTVNCEWRERDLSSFILLNSRLEIELVPSLPRNEGHVFFEPVHNPEYRTGGALDDSGSLVKYYKPHKFLSLMYDVCTVLIYGCGLRPVFVHGSSDAAGERVLNLVMGTLALADKLSSSVHPSRPKIAIVVREGRAEMVKLAREISRCIVVTIGRRKRAGALVYTFRELPHNIERDTCCSAFTGYSKLAGYYASPKKFIGHSGMSAFAQLTTLWPSVCKRGDIKHPTCSRDPRWIGVMVCLAEWQGQRGIADAVAPGALEALRATLAEATG